MLSFVKCKPVFLAFTVFFAIYSVFWYLSNPRLLVLLTIIISIVIVLALGCALLKERTA